MATRTAQAEAAMQIAIATAVKCALPHVATAEATNARQRVLQRALLLRQRQETLNAIARKRTRTCVRREATVPSEKLSTRATLALATGSAAARIMNANTGTLKEREVS